MSDCFNVHVRLSQGDQVLNELGAREGVSLKPAVLQEFILSLVNLENQQDGLRTYFKIARRSDIET